MPFIQKYGVNPVSGAPLTIKGLIKLSYFKNDAGALRGERVKKRCEEEARRGGVKRRREGEA